MLLMQNVPLYFLHKVIEMIFMYFMNIKAIFGYIIIQNIEYLMEFQQQNSIFIYAYQG